MRRQLGLTLVVIAMVFSMVATAGATGSVKQTATVSWHAQQAPLGKTGIVGGTGSVVRSNQGINFNLSTSELVEGNAYTVWLVVINNPSFCAATPCTAPEIFNPESRSQVRFGDGLVAGSSGRGIFSGSVSEGPLSGWLPDGALEDARTAEIHLVVNDHGPAIDEFMPGMVRTYRGGCSDASPFPAIFPATALADGEVGPNICRLYQASVLAP